MNFKKIKQLFQNPYKRDLEEALCREKRGREIIDAQRKRIYDLEARVRELEAKVGDLVCPSKIPTPELKDAMSGIMVTLGTDTERRFAWCLRKVNGEDMIFLHVRNDGFSKFNADDYITSFPVSSIMYCLDRRRRI